MVEVSHYLRISYHTLYSWLRPVRFSIDDGYVTRPVIQRPRGSNRLSFLNLVEAHVVKGLQSAHNLPLPEIRQAVEYTQRKLQIDRLLVSDKLMAGPSGLFVKHLGQLINVGRSGQLGIEKMLERYLERIEFERGLAAKLYPFVLDRNDRLVYISPYISFGKAVVSPRAISTAIIAQRFNEGEQEKEIARDYGIRTAEVEEAIFYESAA